MRGAKSTGPGRRPGEAKERGPRAAKGGPGPRPKGGPRGGSRGGPRAGPGGEARGGSFGSPGGPSRGGSSGSPRGRSPGTPRGGPRGGSPGTPRGGSRGAPSRGARGGPPGAARGVARGGPKRRPPPPKPPPGEPELAVEGDPDEGDGLVRLNKFLADHGIASRRRSDELIALGKISVDGEPATELGMRIDPERQTVEVDGYVLKAGALRRRYYLLNKPPGVVCTNEPRETRPRAIDLVTDPRKGRIYTVGRLDEESRGLILLTNDGDFANRIMHPRFGVEKTYIVKLAGRIEDDALQHVREGVHLSEGRTAGARILVLERTRDSSTVAITLREGMNREIRRAFARVGSKVVDLKRTRIGPIGDRGLKIGRWRELERGEVEALLAGRNEADERRPGRRGAGAKRGAGGGRKRR